MSDSDVIFSLRPDDQSVLAFDACYHPHNTRYLKHDDESQSLYSREVSPITCDGDEDQGYRNTELQFRFNQRPRVIQDGIVFGSNSDVCDFLLQDTREIKKRKRYQKNVSGKHFCITFDNQARLVLRSYPNAPPMRVSYNGQCAGDDSKRRNFAWILFPDVEIKIFVHGRLVFEARIPHHDPTQLNLYLQELRQCRAEGLPPILNLNIESQPTTVGEFDVPTQRQLPLYYNEGEVGRGEFGVVYCDKDVSTGVRTAKKVFYPNKNFRNEVNILGSLSHVSTRLYC